MVIRGPPILHPTSTQLARDRKSVASVTHEHPEPSHVILRDAADRRRAERVLEAAGRPIPFYHRIESSVILDRGTTSWWVSVAGAEPSGFAVEERRLPLGHRLLHLRRLGATVAPEAIAAAADAIAAIEREGGTLRTTVELFSPDESHRLALADALAARGFRDGVATGYRDTILVDLRPAESDILASFSGSARRNVRAVAKGAIAVRPIEDPALAPRVDAILHASLTRTGAGHHRRDWHARIAFARRHPELARLAGVFRTDRAGPDALVAFAWGCAHGDHVEYSDAGSLRVADLRVPLGYALVWDIACWGKGLGAQWFDLGGVTSGRLGDPEDPLGGISDFKRTFSTNTLRVADHLESHPRSLRARAARTLHSLVRRLR